MPPPGSAPTSSSDAKNRAQVDGWTVAELCRTAAGQFVRQARHGNDPTKFRVDVRRKVEVPDKAIATLGRAHSVAVRISITCESMLFDHGRDATAVLLPELE
jgi:hypothetical protein